MHRSAKTNFRHNLLPRLPSSSHANNNTSASRREDGTVQLPTPEPSQIVRSRARTERGASTAAAHPMSIDARSLKRPQRRSMQHIHGPEAAASAACAPERAADLSRSRYG
ncbi:hypothetical protein VTO73DRAFT_9475 [Trametes versicolor]